MSSVPCSRSIGFATVSPFASRRENSTTLLDCQGEHDPALEIFGAQKSKRSASGPVRGPALAEVSLDCSAPNVCGPLTSPAGGALVVWFSTLVKVDSNRSLAFSPSRNVFPNPAETPIVPGPPKIPTPQFPIRPAPTGVGANALKLKYCAAVRFAGVGFPTQSGRSNVARLAISVFDWSSVGLMMGVSHGPVCSSVTVLASQPPSSRFCQPELLSHLRPLPNGSW